jgi:hypothetical protein
MKASKAASHAGEKIDNTARIMRRSGRPHKEALALFPVCVGKGEKQDERIP